MRRRDDRRTRSGLLVFCTLLLASAATGCRGEAQIASHPPAPACDPDDGGLTLPPGFCALVVADGIGPARHLAVAPNGDIYVALLNRRDAPGALLALRDEDGDGRAEIQERIGENGGSGIALDREYLYFATDDAVLRYPITPGQLLPAGPPDTIVSGLPADRSHRAKTIALGRDGRIFVNIGSPSNACQERDRTAGSPGLDPCPELETRAGIWSFQADRLRQRQADGERYATGIRNAVALTTHPVTGELYAVQHGRDQLAANWPELFTVEQNAELPAEEFFHVERGADYGWPYCYYDGLQQKKVLAPEYGGNGRTIGRCAEARDPLVALPAHWGPNALLFYSGTGPAAFPAEYRGGAFIAFHGSWNRAPLEQQGYNVVFVPFDGPRPSGEPSVFADGFAGEARDPRGASHRPAGLAEGPDGSLYISDDAGGRIWRILYVGDRSR